MQTVIGLQQPLDHVVLDDRLELSRHSARKVIADCPGKLSRKARVTCRS